MLNVNAMACIFKPLWKPIGELKIRDMGDNILLLKFEDMPDLENVYLNMKLGCMIET